MNKGLNIGIDIDGVLGDFNSVYWVWHNENFGTDINPNTDCTEYDYSKILKAKGFDIDLQTEVNRIGEFLENCDLVESIPLIPGSRKGVEQLHEIANLYVITARFVHAKESTERWIQSNYPDLFKKVISTGSSYGVNKFQLTKAMVGQQYKLDWMIEDAVYHAKEMLEIGAQVVLLEQPWNKDVEFKHENLYRVKDWNEVVECIKKVELNN